MLDGFYIPTHKMAAVGKTTFPRVPEHTDRCRCVRHLIEAQLKNEGRERTARGDNGERIRRSWKRGIGRQA